MNRCPYCFKPLPENGVCSCHYEESPYFTNREVLHPGSIVGASYQIGMVLGQGGFGITYHGFDLDLEKEVAIKEFYPKGLVARIGAFSHPVTKIAANVSQVVAVSTDNNEFYRKSLNSFYKEAKALAKMSNISNVAHVYRIFRENDTAYMVMDFIEGKSLRKTLQENGPFREAELIPLMDPVLEALQKVHELGIVHRDIAPDNIVINSKGEPVLLDFGASKQEHMQNADDDHLASSSLIVQKKGYSPVEQLSGESDLRSDIYALGATYYTLLAGRVPQESIKRVMRDDVKPLSDYGISPAVSDAVMKAMAVNINDRWNSVAEFRRALSDRTDSQIERTYNQARDLMLFEKYDEAADLLSHISGYKNSEMLLNQCREQISRRVENERTYSQAKDLMMSENYDVAADLLSGISGYKNSEVLLSQCREQISRRVENERNSSFIGFEPAPEEKPRDKAELPTVYTKLPDEIINNTYMKKKEKGEIREKEKKKFPVIPVILVLAVIAAVVSILLGTKGTIIPGGSTQTPAAAEIKAGDEYTFGHYEQDGAAGADDIKWQVLAVENGRALLISKYGLEAKAYHNTPMEVTWEKSDLRNWLNKDFFNSAFSSDEQSRIAEVRNSNPDNNGTGGGNDTQDKVFLLSIDEANKYFGSPEARQVEPSKAAGEKAYANDANKSRWWLRSPGSSSVYAAYVPSNGSVNSGGSDVSKSDYVVRPALWIDMK